MTALAASPASFQPSKAAIMTASFSSGRSSSSITPSSCRQDSTLRLTRLATHEPPRSGPLGHGRHPGRHRALLDRRGARDRRRARRHVERRVRPPARRQRPDGVGRASSATTARSTWSPERIVDELLVRVVAQVREHVPWRPGARELLDALRAEGVPSALVTMSWRSLADAVVSALPEGTFAVVVTGDEVAHGKPHPEPYRAAARALGVEAERLRGHRGLADRGALGGRRGRADPRRAARGAGARRSPGPCTSTTCGG